MPIVCPRCKSPAPDAAKFCARCGASLHPLAIRSTTKPSPLLARWRMLTYSLTRKELRRLLGEPKRIEPPATPAADGIERWLYEYEAAQGDGRVVQGEVRLLISESRVTSWTEPDWDKLRPDAGGDLPPQSSDNLQTR